MRSGEEENLVLDFASLGKEKLNILDILIRLAKYLNQYYILADGYVFFMLPPENAEAE